MLNQRWSRKVAEIMELYRQLDAEVDAFARQFEIHCVRGCGACCLSPHVETTVAEMLPLAVQLFETGQLERTLERLQQGGSVCVQYAAEPHHPERGRCQTYDKRPVLCRLFGFTGSRDKAGQLRYGACRVLQKAEAERIQATDAALKQGAASIPMLAPAHERMAEIAGPLGTEMLPINQALLRAIEVVGLLEQLGDEAAYGCSAGET